MGCNGRKTNKQTFKVYAGKFQLKLLHLVLGFYFARVIKEGAENRFFRRTEKKMASMR
jgi:hypothetical protein